LRDAGKLADRWTAVARGAQARKVAPPGTSVASIGVLGEKNSWEITATFRVF
jgi:hypothetical protein